MIAHNQRYRYALTRPPICQAALLVAIVCLLNATLTADETSNLVVVDVVPAKRVNSVEETRRFAGILESRRSSVLSFERIGKLATVHVDEGTVVKSGDVLAELATDRLAAERAKLVADKAMRQAELAELIAGPRKETIAASRARVEQAAQELEQARRNLARRESLLSKRLVASELVEQAQTEVATAVAEWNARKQQLLELENGTRQEQIDVKRAQVEAIVASIRVVDADLDNSRIKAPYSGTVVDRSIDEGTIIAPGQRVLEVSETTELRARFGVPADVGRSVTRGQLVQVEVNGKVYPGKVSAFVSRLQATTRTQTVLVRFPDQEFPAHDGQVAQLLLRNPTEIDGYVLPRSALTRGSRGLWNCYIATGDNERRKVERRIVDVARILGDKVIVRGNLSDGDLVVASATHRVTAQQRVRTRQSESIANQESPVRSAFVPPQNQGGK